MGGSRETMCTSCIHREICMFKDDYLKVVEAVNSAEVYIPAGEVAGIKKVREYDFVEIVDPKCKHYMKDIPVPRMPIYEGSILYTKEGK